jgi:1-phosphatidylinositol phosphodiesterase
MGAGGYLWIINATSQTLKNISCHNYQMNAWNFSDIPSQTQKVFYIEYDQRPFKTKQDDKGEATFELEGTSSSFELQVSWPDGKGEGGLQICWKVDVDLYESFPPGFPGGAVSRLGWIHNGTLALLILEKGVTSIVPCRLPGEDSIVPSVAQNLTLPFCGLWMEKYSGLLGKLTLTEITLPGTHNSGTYQPASQIGSVWIKCQALSLEQQLQHGVRVFDLRIGQKSPGDYIICHDAWHTRYSLAQALKEVTGFIDKSNKEIVVLDFHRFVKLGNQQYDYSQLKKQISSALTGYCVPTSCIGKTLGEIWCECNQKERIVVAWNTDSPDPYMWPGVNQRWYSDADSPSKLYRCIESDTLSPPPGMWAACAFMKPSALHTPVSNAVHINPTITNWYFGGSTFCENSNIVSVDFFSKHSNIVQAAVIGSLLSAGKKQ